MCYHETLNDLTEAINGPGVYDIADTVLEELQTILPHAEDNQFCRIKSFLACYSRDEKGAFVRVIGPYVEIKDSVISMGDADIPATNEISIFYDEINIKTFRVPTLEMMAIDKGFADKHGLVFEDEHDWKLFKVWMEEQLYFAKNHIVYEYPKAGWKTNGKMTHFILDKTYARNESGVVFCHKTSRYNKPEAFMPVGSWKMWLTGIKEHVVGHFMLELAVAISLAAPLFALLEVNVSPIWCFVGRSTTGKTTALKLAMSVWCEPSKKDGSLYQTWNQTDNAALDLVKVFCGLPLGLDDTSASKLSKKECENILYALSEGSSKGRSSVSGALQETTTNFNAFITTSEESLINENTKDGLRRRFFELEYQVTDSSSHALAIQKLYSSHHGVFGRVYIQYLLKRGYDQIQHDHEAAFTSLLANANNNFDHRLIRIWAVLYQSLQYLSRFKVGDQTIGLDMERIRDQINKEIHKIEKRCNNEEPAWRFLMRVIWYAAGKEKAFNGTASGWGYHKEDPKTHTHTVGLTTTSDKEVYESLRNIGISATAVHSRLAEMGFLKTNYEHDTLRYNAKKSVGGHHYRVYEYVIDEDVYNAYKNGSTYKDYQKVIIGKKEKSNMDGDDYV